jgi:GntR family transcriptional repressor for pyruvate dehydrogenase complex
MTEQQVQPRTRRKPRSLAQELVTVLTERIRSGQLKPGDKLPTESQIMAEEGVSRTVVREAISRLQAAGQVETRHGIGTFVLDAPTAAGFRIDPATVVTLREVLAVLELRIALESSRPGLPRSGAATSSWPACAALDELNEGAAHASDAVSADFQFHLRIAQASGNHYFADIINHLGTSIIPRTRLNSARLAHDDQAHYMGRLMHEHEAIYEAIARHDSEGAKMAMRLHLSNSASACARPMNRPGTRAELFYLGNDPCCLPIWLLAHD